MAFNWLCDCKMMEADISRLRGVRLPVGSYGGSLKTVSAIDMGAMVVKEAVKRAGIEPAQVDEVIVGQVGQIAECGFVARAISLAAAALSFSENMI